MGFAMLYAGICPLATLIICVYFMFDNALMRYSESNYQQRPMQKNMVSLGSAWINYLEVVTGIVTITNTFLLFFVSSAFKDFLKNNLGISGKNQQLWLILGVEHGLLALLLFVKAGIADFPRALLKIKERTTTELRESGTVTFSQEANQKVIVQQKQNTQDQLKKNVKGLIEYYNKGTKEINIREGQLVDFLKMDPREYESRLLMAEINNALNVNFRNKLFRETFLIIERTILQRKMLQLQRASSVIQVHCAQCTSQMATLYCLDCLDHMCSSCAD